MAQVVRIASGDFDPGKLTLFSIFRDEIFFAPAFFDHYRRIGVQQFLILDDGSTDGTGAFLGAQEDCVTLTSSLRFGDRLWYSMPDGERVFGRAGTAFKTLIPHHFLQGSYAVYADADEFLILPDGVDQLGLVIDRLRARGERSVAGPLVEFFPESLQSPGAEAAPPQSARDLFAANPWFEPDALVRLDGHGGFAKFGATKSEQLFRQHGIKGAVLGFGQKPTSPRSKTPIVEHGPAAFRLGSHTANVPVSSTIMLPMAHFVFSSNHLAKIDRARAWKSHAQGGAKYTHYARLVARMRAQNARLVGPHSRRFDSGRDLHEAGHLLWPSDQG